MLSLPSRLLPNVLALRLEADRSKMSYLSHRRALHPGPDGKTANTLGPLLPPLSSGNGRKHGGGGLRSRDADDRVLSITTANCLAYLCALRSVCACVCVSRREDTRHATRFGPHPFPLQKNPPQAYAVRQISRSRHINAVCIRLYSSSSSFSFLLFFLLLSLSSQTGNHRERERTVEVTNN